MISSRQGLGSWPMKRPSRLREAHRNLPRPPPPNKDLHGRHDRSDVRTQQNFNRFDVGRRLLFLEQTLEESDHFGLIAQRCSGKNSRETFGPNPKIPFWTCPRRAWKTLADKGTLGLPQVRIRARTCSGQASQALSARMVPRELLKITAGARHFFGPPNRRCRILSFTVEAGSPTSAIWWPKKSASPRSF